MKLFYHHFWIKLAAQKKTLANAKKKSYEAIFLCNSVECMSGYCSFYHHFLSASTELYSDFNKLKKKKCAWIEKKKRQRLPKANQLLLILNNKLDDKSFYFYRLNSNLKQIWTFSTKLCRERKTVFFFLIKSKWIPFAQRVINVIWNEK